jgi:surface polysaccharide O-acyltransferase-like enzyme
MDDQLCPQAPFSAFRFAGRLGAENGVRPLLEQSNPRAARFSALDFIRAYAIILVVMLHAAAPPLYAFKDVPRAYWWTANLFDSFARPCVPLFVMVSGFLLLDASKEESVLVFFRKRFAKVLVPYLFWASFYLWWRWYFHKESFAEPGKLSREFVGGTAYYHLVFMNIIIGLYLLTPILRVFVKYASLPTQLYLFFLWFCLSSLGPLVTKVTALSVNAYLQITPLFLGHFLLGSLFKRLRLALRRDYLYALGAVLIVTVYLTAYGTYKYTKRADGLLDEYFYNYASPNVVVMSAISFVLLWTIFSRPEVQRLPLVAPLLRNIGATSFGIYFTHVILLDCLAHGIHGWRLTATTFHPSLAIPLLTAIVVLTCALVLHYVQKVPVVRYLVP